MIQLYAPFLAVLFISFLICYSSRMVRPYESTYQYLFQGNKLHFSISSNIGTIFSLTGFVTACLTLGFLYGAVVGILIVAICMSGTTFLFIRMFSSKRIRTYFCRQEVLRPSILDFVGFSLGHRMKLFVSCIALVYILSFLTLEVGLLRTLYSQISPTIILSPSSFIFLFLLICTLYVTIGGFEGILKNDVFQLFVFTAYVLAVIAYILLDSRLRLPADRIFLFGQRQLTSLEGVMNIAGVILFVCCWLLASVDLWIRTIGTLKTPKAARASVLWALPLMAAFSVFPISAGAWVNARDLLSREQVLSLPFFAANSLLEGATPFFQGLCIAALAAASLTTVDTFLITSAQVYYGLGRTYRKEAWLNADPRVFLCLSAFVAYFASYLIDKSSFFDYTFIFLNVTLFVSFVIFCSIAVPGWFNRLVAPRDLLLAIILSYLAISLEYWSDSTFLLRKYYLLPFYSFGSIVIVLFIKSTLRRVSVFGGQKGKQGRKEERSRDENS